MYFSRYSAVGNSLRLSTAFYVRVLPAASRSVKHQYFSLGAGTSVSDETSSSGTRIVWFREHALRIHDNEAIAAAIADSSNSQNDDSSILPVYLWTSVGSDPMDSSHGPHPVDEKTGGTAKDVFVANALQSLNSTLAGSLILGSVQTEEEHDGDTSTKAIQELIQICQKSNAKEVYYLKSHRENDSDVVARELLENGITPRPFGGSFSLIDYSEHVVPWKEIILEHPWRSPLIPFVDYVKKQMAGRKAAEVSESSDPVPDERNGVPEGLFQYLHKANNAVVNRPLHIDELGNSVGITKGGTKWGTGISTAWPATQESAKSSLDTFLASLESKDDGVKRTHLASRLSPYLARGMLSPQQVYDGIVSIGDDTDTDSFVRRIFWRDYTYAVAALYPDVTKGKSIRDGYELLDGDIGGGTEKEKEYYLDQWKKGQCGFPLVDAGMRQLASEGWMPQKVRLACSTFLVEGLGLSWRLGMQHFEEFLVDYDSAINSNMWMNAGCVGLDPYYVGMNYKRRMYWDKDGSYVRKWCPELKNLPDSFEIDLGKTTKIVDCLYEPWSSPLEVLKEAKIQLGKTYPERVCDDRKTRSKFFADVRSLRSQWPESRTDDKKRDLVSIGSAGSIGLFTPNAVQTREQRKTEEKMD